MAIYPNAVFGSVKTTKRGLYEPLNKIIWFDLLDRTNLYEYNEDIQDNDYIYNNEMMKEFFKLPSSTVTISGKIGRAHV